MVEPHIEAVCIGSGTWRRDLRCIPALQDSSQRKEGSAGQPAAPRLDAYSANVAEGSGDSVPAVLGLRSMSKMRTILILEQGREEMIIPGVEM
eukprot:5653697-Pyramimonas_sp.AAC.1